MTESEKYRLVLLKCERTFESVGNIIAILKKADKNDLPKLIEGINIDTNHIRQSILDALEP